jgi:nucleoside phosphorylase
VRCQQRVLVLSAMPLELNPLVRGAALTATRSKDGHLFYEGRLQGVDVLLAMTGIGPANAARTTEAALGLSSCPFRAAVFSGVAGSRGFIGDVAVPRRWTSDNGKSWHGVDAAMLRVSRALDAKKLKLIQDVPVGDAACACPGVDAPTPVHLPQAPVLRIGGDGTTSDPFGGRAVPCVPGGGDIAGCEPCLTAEGVPSNAQTFASRAPSMLDPGFFQALFQPPAATTSTADAQDEETDAVLQVANKHRLPFLGIRAVSDGKGDPLGLPGFPVQFAVYRQLAANNAATVAMAFLQSWRAAGLPTSR